MRRVDIQISVVKSTSISKQFRLGPFGHGWRSAFESKEDNDYEFMFEFDEIQSEFCITYRAANNLSSSMKGSKTTQSQGMAFPLGSTGTSFG